MFKHVLCLRLEGYRVEVVFFGEGVELGDFAWVADFGDVQGGVKVVPELAEESPAQCVFWQHVEDAECKLAAREREGNLRVPRPVGASVGVYDVR